MIYEIINGALMMGCFTVGLFFHKFWKKTSERLFIMFACAFWMLSIERLALGYVGHRNEPSIYIYMIRLAAFLLILFAIIDKNREKSSK